VIAAAHLRTDEAGGAATRRREAPSRRITLAGQDIEYRLVRARRLALGLTQKMVGECIGKTKMAISHIENEYGQKHTRLATYLALCEVLGIKVHGVTVGT
jgi:DNA-binding XRE family transcriptional regulator